MINVFRAPHGDNSILWVWDRIWQVVVLALLLYQLLK